jgi:hypothetical protein
MTGATLNKNLQRETEKFTKKAKRLAGHLILHPALFKHSCESELPRWQEHVQKSKVVEMVSSRFYCLDEIMDKLIAGLAMEELV